MSRTVEVSILSEKRDPFLERIRGAPGIVSISVQRGASIDPPGDVVTIKGTNRAVDEVMRVVGELDLLDHGSLSISVPAALVAPPQRRPIEHQSNEASWEEIDDLLRRNTNISINYLGLMILSGAIASVGLLQDTLHIVIGAMLVAPGFEPLIRIIFGPLSGHWRATGMGVRTTLVGYLMLAFGAAVGLLVTVSLDPTVPADLSGQYWIGYWTNVTWPGAIVASFAGVAGAVVVNSRETVFATGVMVALALIPSMAVVGMGLAAGEFALALKGLGRWGVDAACVVVASFLALSVKRTLTHPRRTLF